MASTPHKRTPPHKNTKRKNSQVNNSFEEREQKKKEQRTPEKYTPVKQSSFGNNLNEQKTGMSKHVPMNSPQNSPKNSPKKQQANTSSLSSPQAPNVSTLCYPVYPTPLSLAYTSAIPALSLQTPYFQSFPRLFSYPGEILTTAITTFYQSPVQFTMPPPPLSVPRSVFDLSPRMLPPYPYTTMHTAPVYTAPLPIFAPIEAPIPIPYPNKRHFPEHPYQEVSEPNHLEQREARSYNTERSVVNHEANVKANTSGLIDPEQYLRLPRALFPTARMQKNIAPNMIIDVICMEQNISDHAPWILDLELGSPRYRRNDRPIAIYDLNHSNIYCKGNPGCIHPGFDRCSSSLKSLLLYNYGRIISNWYNGFIIFNEDSSTQSFMAWLQTPLELYGMCWP